MGFLSRLFGSSADKNESNNSSESPQVSYVLEGEPKTWEDFEKVFKAFGLKKYAAKAKHLVRPKIDLKPTLSSDEELLIGASKIGGQPDLPSTMEWPADGAGKPLAFIAQLNLSEVSPFDKENRLPKSGILSFFYSAEQEFWGYDPNDKLGFRVIYSDENSDFARRDFPENLAEEGMYTPRSVEFDNSLSLPGCEYDEVSDLLGDDDEASDSWYDLASGKGDQLLGYPDVIQNTMELECQLVTNGLYCGDATGYNDPRREELEKNADDWVLLLQIDSDEVDDTMMWGDCGMLYFWIKKQDLAVGKFENCWCILQCY